MNRAVDTLSLEYYTPLEFAYNKLQRQFYTCWWGNNNLYFTFLVGKHCCSLNCFCKAFNTARKIYIDLTILLPVSQEEVDLPKLNYLQIFPCIG